MDRSLIVAGFGVVGTFAVAIAVGALIAAASAQLALADEPPARVAVVRAPPAPRVNAPAPSRAQSGRARDGSAVIAAKPARSVRSASRVAVDEPVDWTESTAPTESRSMASVADVEPEFEFDAEEDLSDFDLVLEPRGGSDADTGRRR